MMKKLLLFSAVVLSITGWVIHEKSKPAVTITVENQTDQLLSHVRLESGPSKKNSETIPLAPTEKMSWNFHAKEKSFVRLQYQTESKQANDVIISGYLEPQTTGFIETIIHGENGKYHVSVNQSIRH